MSGSSNSNNNNNFNQGSFPPASTKLRIASIDDPDVQIAAQYNPKELTISKSVTWDDHKSITSTTEENSRQGNSEQDDLTFKGGSPRTLSIELLFDGYEENQSVEKDVRTLEKLTSVQKPDGNSDEEPLKRPPHCIITWGLGNERMRPFLCVINKLDVKYMVWDRSGKPLRATCTISVTEALQMKKMQNIATPGTLREGQRDRRPLRSASRSRSR